MQVQKDAFAALRLLVDRANAPPVCSPVARKYVDVSPSQRSSLFGLVQVGIGAALTETAPLV